MAFCVALYTSTAALLAHRRQRVRLRESARGAAAATALCYSVAVLALEYLLVSGDYQVRAVYNHTNGTMPLVYKMAALWGGNSGSVLFWGWLLSLCVLWIAWRGFGGRSNRLSLQTMALLSAQLGFFAGLSCWSVNPFSPVLGSPTNGVGLDPLLLNPVMILHPPAMYTGLVALGVPTALLASALWHRAPGSEWLPLVRRWLLFSWTGLSAALILGGMWAYWELGWGGYWEWDPVENAALLPWLAATAGLHGLNLVQRRRGALGWPAAAIASAFLLSLMGTYITRSGVLKNSVHAFTGTGLGPYFLVLFGGAAFLILGLFWVRRDLLWTTGGWVRAAFTYRTLFQSFSAIAVIVLVGTFFPVISQMVGRQSVVLTQRFFNTATVPFFLVVVVALGLAPLVTEGSSGEHLAPTRIRAPVMGGVAAAAFSLAWGYRNPLAIVSLGATGFAVVPWGREGLLAVRSGLARWGRRRLGSALVHLGFLLAVVGIVGSHTNAQAVTERLWPGQGMRIEGYQVQYRRLLSHSTPGVTRLSALLRVSRDGQHFWVSPGLSFFDGMVQPVADVSIRQGLMQNLYLVLEATTSHNGAILEVMVNPMVTWIWLALPLTVLGSLLAWLGGVGPETGQPARLVPSGGGLGREPG